jgi:glutamate formiminotransferase/glutamate formiminotransferase/formiminotetrahydrofolate cyclodeaminase
MLFAVPNVSEGRHGAAIIGIEQAFAAPAGVKLLDTHYDRDHHRSVFWLAGEPGRLAEALVQGAKEAAGWINLQEPRGVHPHVGALDVAPIVYARPEDRGAAGGWGRRPGFPSTSTASWPAGAPGPSCGAAG